MADDASKAEAIQNFCGITGATPHVAEHYLSGFNYDVERAMNFFFENPPDQAGLGVGQADDMTEEDARAAAAAFEDEDMGRPRFGGAAPGAGAIDLTAADEDDGLQRALAGSMHAEPASTRPRAGPPPAAAAAHAPRWGAAGAGDEDEEDEEEMLRTMAAHRDAAIAAARESERMMGGDSAMMNMTRGMAGQAGAVGPSIFPNTEGLPAFGGPAAALGVQGRRIQGLGGAGPAAAGGRRGVVVEEPDSDEDMPPAFGGRSGRSQADDDEALARRLMEEDEAMNARARGGMGAGAGPGAGAGMGMGDDEDPEHVALGVDRHELEEARMIEAAMLGIPYEPRLPTRGAGGAGASGANAAPEVRESRDLRWEQDAAYEESLAADRAKAQAAEAAARAAAEAAAKEKAEAEAAQRAADEEAARVASALSKAQAELPAEPAAGEGVVNVMVRMPDGSRQGRRFKTSDPLQAIFHFVDVKHQAATLKPGSYALVNSYPRKVFPSGGAGTLADAGITADTALFIEPSSSS